MKQLMNEMKAKAFFFQNLLIDLRQQIYTMHHKIKPWFTKIGRQLAPMLRPQSLSFQMAFAALTIAVVAIIAIILISSISVSSSFSNYLQEQLRESADSGANRISFFYRSNDHDLNGAIGSAFFLGQQIDQLQARNTEAATAASQMHEQIWTLDAKQSTNILYWDANLTTIDKADAAIIDPVLRQVIKQGTPFQGELPDPNHLWLHYPARAYAAVPIYENPSLRKNIIGALAISSEKSLSNYGGSSFVRNVDRVLIVGGLAITVVIAVAGALLARRITFPLAKLNRAAQRMRGRDLSARVDIDPETSSDEIAQLAQTFNEMAASLERDVNELRRQHQIQRELIANVAHELATPLTAIHGYSEALVDGMVSDNEREKVSRIIHRETERLQFLVDQLRQVARLESGGEQMELVPLSLHAMVSDTQAVLAGESKRRGVIIRNLIPTDLPPVMADANRMTQVILNLLDNAIVHIPEGGTIRVESEIEDNWLWVHISDTGTGIPADKLDRIFERFYRADPSRNRTTGGSGLGLSIVKGIVEAHGGHVKAANNPAGGAKISFCIPLVLQPIPPTKKRGLSLRLSKPLVASRKIKESSAVG
jgi:signal transduction histidine kinase